MDGLTLEGEIVGVLSNIGWKVDVEQHISDKTHIPNALRFWMKMRFCSDTVLDFDIGPNSTLQHRLVK
jgi:hypothetical protein